MNLKTIILVAALSYFPSCVNKQSTRFELEYLSQDKPVVVDFYTNWCGICNVARPHFESLSREYQGKVNFVRYNCDDDPNTCNGYNIHGVPTFIFFNDKSEVSRLNGFTNEQDLRNFIESALND